MMRGKPPDAADGADGPDGGGGGQLPLFAETPPAARQALAGLAREALASGRRVLLTVNNNAEGCAPLSIVALARELAASGRPPADRR